MVCQFPVVICIVKDKIVSYCKQQKLYFVRKLKEDGEVLGNYVFKTFKVEEQ